MGQTAYQPINYQQYDRIFFLGKFPPEPNDGSFGITNPPGPRVVLGGEMGGPKRCTEQKRLNFDELGRFQRRVSSVCPFFCFFCFGSCWLLDSKYRYFFCRPKVVAHKLRKFRQSILHQTFNLWICSSNFGGSLGQACNLWGCWLSSQMTRPR